MESGGFARDTARAMSLENVEIVRRAYSGGDLNALAIEILHPEVELLGAIGGMEEGTVIRGREAVTQALDVDSEIWAGRRMELERAIDAGDQVVALVHEYRRGKGSGVTVEADIALVYGFKEGKVVRIEPYMSQADALEAAGLSE
jgi:ketosteroid isomerase-like protein